MTADRIQLLNKIGFEWECHHNQPWDILYKELVSFVKEFDHARVPRKFPLNASLGTWVATQRQGYKKYLKGDVSTKMTADRIQLLNKISFEWVIRSKLKLSS